MTARHSFSVILEPQEGGGFTVLVPALPEVITEGDTEQEALLNAEAIRAVLDYRRDHGIVIPSDAARKFAESQSWPKMAGGKLPAVDGRHVIRALTRAGFIIDRVVGSHHVMVFPRDPRRTVTVPVHSGRDLKTWNAARDHPQSRLQCGGVQRPSITSR